MLDNNRHEHGALDFETIQVHPRSHQEVIEDFMIAANSVVAKYLKSQGHPSLRRVVRTPKKMPAILREAAKLNYTLPETPNSNALAKFLQLKKIADPLRFSDLSLTIIKLRGKGKYILELPGEETTGHFGLAVIDYTHSTAPNRRFPDLTTQRLLKAALCGERFAYRNYELAELAAHCTRQEDVVNKIERHVAKPAAALLLSSRRGELFDALCTGAANKGTWVRIFSPPVEGRLTVGFAGVNVGDRLMVELIHTDIERGYIDFKRA